ncbi:MAG: hypothetical protein DI601_18740 [Azospirillum brasilense]|nr:MAG: hypothetical protein DI601_18740 [Azospirillum brasilense]
MRHRRAGPAPPPAGSAAEARWRGRRRKAPPGRSGRPGRRAARPAGPPPAACPHSHARNAGGGPARVPPTAGRIPRARPGTGAARR